jgi:uncharacterized protein HemX
MSSGVAIALIVAAALLSFGLSWWLFRQRVAGAGEAEKAAKADADAARQQAAEAAKAVAQLTDALAASAAHVVRLKEELDAEYKTKGLSAQDIVARLRRIAG